VGELLGPFCLIFSIRRITPDIAQWDMESFRLGLRPCSGLGTSGHGRKAYAVRRIQHHVQQVWAQNPLVALGHVLAEWFFRFLAGFVAGFGAGYISHIILDFGAPRCVPFVA